MLFFQMGYYPTFEERKARRNYVWYIIYKLEKDVIEAEIDIMKRDGHEIKTGIER